MLLLTTLFLNSFCSQESIEQTYTITYKDENAQEIDRKNILNIKIKSKLRDCLAVNNEVPENFLTTFPQIEKKIKKDSKNTTTEKKDHKFYLMIDNKKIDLSNDKNFLQTFQKEEINTITNPDSKGSDNKDTITNDILNKTYIDYSINDVEYDSYKGYGKFIEIDTSIFGINEKKQKINLEDVIPNLQIKNIYSTALKKIKVQLGDGDKKNNKTFVINRIKVVDIESGVEDNEDDFFRFCKQEIHKQNNKSEILDSMIESKCNLIKNEIERITEKLEFNTQFLIDLCYLPSEDLRKKLEKEKLNFLQNMKTESNNKILGEFITKPKDAFINFPIHEILEYFTKSIDEQYNKTCYKQFPILKEFLIQKLLSDNEFIEKISDKVIYNPVYFYKFITDLTTNIKDNKIEDDVIEDNSTLSYFEIQKILKNYNHKDISNVLEKQVQQIAFCMFLYQILNEILFMNIYINNIDVVNNKDFKEFDFSDEFEKLKELTNNDEILNNFVSNKHAEIKATLYKKYDGIYSNLNNNNNADTKYIIDHTLYRIIEQKNGKKTFFVIMHMPFTNDSYIIRNDLQNETVINDKITQIYGNLKYSISLYLIKLHNLEINEPKTASKTIHTYKKMSNLFDLLLRLNFTTNFRKECTLTEIENVKDNENLSNASNHLFDEDSFVKTCTDMIHVFENLSTNLSHDYIFFTNNKNIFEQLIYFMTYIEEASSLFLNSINFQDSLISSIKQYYKLPLFQTEILNSQKIDQISHFIFSPKKQTKNNDYFISKKIIYKNLNESLVKMFEHSLHFAKNNILFDNLKREKEMVNEKISNLIEKYSNLYRDENNQIIIKTNIDDHSYLNLVVKVNEIYSTHALKIDNIIRDLFNQLNYISIISQQILDLFFVKNAIVIDNFTIFSEFKDKIYNVISTKNTFVDFFKDEFLNAVESFELNYNENFECFKQQLNNYNDNNKQNTFFQKFTTYIQNVVAEEKCLLNISQLIRTSPKNFLYKENETYFEYLKQKESSKSIPKYLKFVLPEKLNTEQVKLNFFVSYFYNSLKKPYYSNLDDQSKMTLGDIKEDINEIIEILASLEMLTFDLSRLDLNQHSETEDKISTKDLDSDHHKSIEDTTEYSIKIIQKYFGNNKDSIFYYYMNECQELLNNCAKYLDSLNLHNESLSIFTKINIASDKQLEYICNSLLKRHIHINVTIQEIIVFVKSLKNALENNIGHFVHLNREELKIPKVEQLLKEAFTAKILNKQNTIEPIKIDSNQKLIEHYSYKEIYNQQNVLQEKYKHIEEIYNKILTEDNPNDLFKTFCYYSDYGKDDSLVKCTNIIFEIYLTSNMCEKLQYLLKIGESFLQLQAIFNFLSKIENVTIFDVFAMLKFIPEDDIKILEEELDNICLFIHNANQVENVATKVFF